MNGIIDNRLFRIEDVACDDGSNAHIVIWQASAPELLEAIAAKALKTNVEQ